MRILLTSPFAHPEVRRGAERYVSDLVWWLDGRGHSVTLATSTAGSPRQERRAAGGVTFMAHRRRAFGAGRWRIDELLTSGAAVARAVRAAGDGTGWDVAQCHHHPDAAALLLASIGRPRPPYVLWLPGTARRGALGGRPLHRASFRAAVKGAARIHALSEYAAATVRDELGVRADAVPPGVRTTEYEGDKPYTDEPIVLCTASPDDQRKRVELLVRAFPAILRTRPRVRLMLVPPRPSERLDAAVAALDEEVSARVEIRHDVAIDELPGLYRSAAVSVLPSVEEAFGLVIVESLAAGTPVVGASSGAIPEILGGHDEVGRLFAADDADALASAVLGVLELAEDRGTAAACRRHARRWDWATVGPDLERVYAELA